MIIKVCGIKYEKNFNELISIGVDWIGLNFFKGSKRFIENTYLSSSQIVTVGVFVNAEIDYIYQQYEKYKLNYIQLHGGEDDMYCKKVQSFCPVIKVFSVDENFDFTNTKKFDFCDYFMFDTKTPNYGGSGDKFNWNKLKEYKDKVPFILAGGIGPTDTTALYNLNHDMMVGLDLNSRFEVKPGEKEVSKIRTFLSAIKNEIR